MRHAIDTLVSAVRQEAAPRSAGIDAHRAALTATAACESLAAERGIELDAPAPDRPLHVGADGMSSSGSSSR